MKTSKETENSFTGQEKVQTVYQPESKKALPKATGSMFSSILEKLKIDDYILIALMIVFLFDENEENDFLLPILLGIILLF